MITLPRLVPVLLAAVAGLTLGFASPATAADIPVRWMHNVVCVDNHAGSQWPVKEAVRRVDDAVDLVLLYEPCKGHEQVITVGHVDSPRASWAGGTYYEHDEGGLLDSVSIYLNDAAILEHRPANQMSVVVHELLHALGASHVESTTSIMATDGSQYGYTEPQPEDVRTINDIYAWPQGQ